jgi:hypothetical protein
VSRATPFSLPSNGITNVFHDGAVLGLTLRDFNLGLVTFFRFDVDSLTVTAETVDVTATAQNVYPCSGSGAMGWVERAAGEVRLVTLRSHLTARTLSTELEEGRVALQCLLGEELWREERAADGTWHLLRTQGELVRVDAVWWSSASFLGTRPLLERADDPLRRQWIGGADGSIDKAVPLGRIPKRVFPLRTDDPDVVISLGATIEGKWSLFRLRLPEAR